MTINDLIPARRARGRHRASDEVDRLRRENRGLAARLAVAEGAIAILRGDLDDAHAKQAEAEELVVQLDADAFDLAAERDCHAEELAALKAKFAVELAAEANAHRITVPPAIRPIDGPEDQATGPIGVRPLQEAAALGLLGPVTDPGCIR